MAGKGLHFKSLLLKKKIFGQFASEQQKRWTEATTHKFEEFQLAYFVQIFQDGRFALSEVCVEKGSYMCKIDLKYAFFSAPLHKDSQKLVRFLLAENSYDFMCLYFSFGPAPWVFTKLLKASISVFRHFVMRVIIYLEDLLILGNSMNKIFIAKESVIFPLQHLSFA